MHVSEEVEALNPTAVPCVNLPKRKFDKKPIKGIIPELNERNAVYFISVKKKAKVHLRLLKGSMGIFMWASKTT